MEKIKENFREAGAFSVPGAVVVGVGRGWRPAALWVMDGAPSPVPSEALSAAEKGPASEGD